MSIEKQIHTATHRSTIFIITWQLLQNKQSNTAQVYALEMPSMVPLASQSGEFSYLFCKACCEEVCHSVTSAHIASMLSSNLGQVLGQTEDDVAHTVWCLTLLKAHPQGKLCLSFLKETSKLSVLPFHAAAQATICGSQT